MPPLPGPMSGRGAVTAAVLKGAEAEKFAAGQLAECYTDGQLAGGAVWVVGGFCGHGMPRCFGLARVTARRLLGLPLGPMDARAADRFEAKRFFA